MAYDRDSVAKMIVRMGEWASVYTGYVTQIYTSKSRIEDQVRQLIRLIHDVVLPGQLELNKDFIELAESFQDLYDFVNEYFKNLDLQEEVDNILNKWLEDGTLDLIFSRIIAERFNYKFSITPEEYGAVGDGVTDDTEAFNKCLDYCYENYENAYEIRLSAKTYLIKPIFLRNKISIIGSGIGKTILKENTIDTPVSNQAFVTYQINSVCNILSNLTLYCNRDNTGHGIFFAQTQSSSNPTSSNLTRNHYEDGGIVSAAYKFTLFDNICVENAYNDGFFAPTYNYIIFMRDCHFRNSRRYGINNSSTDNFFVNINAERNGYGGIYENGRHNHWVNVKAHWNGVTTQESVGFHVVGQRCDFTNCEAQHSVHSGWIINGTDNKFTNCLSDMSGQTVNSDGTSTSTPNSYGFKILNDAKMVNCSVENNNPDLILMESPYYIQNITNINDYDIKVNTLNFKTFPMSFKKPCLGVDNDYFWNYMNANIDNGLYLNYNENAYYRLTKELVFKRNFSIIMKFRTLNNLVFPTEIINTDNLIVTMYSSSEFRITANNVNIGIQTVFTPNTNYIFALNINRMSNITNYTSYAIYSNVTNIVKNSFTTDIVAKFDSITFNSDLSLSQIALQQLIIGDNDINIIDLNQDIVCVNDPLIDFNFMSTSYFRENKSNMLTFTSEFDLTPSLYNHGKFYEQSGVLKYCIKNTSGTYEWVAIN